MRKIKINFLLLFFVFTPIIDFINGISREYGLPEIVGTLFRTVFLIYVIFIFFKSTFKENFKYVIFILMTLSLFISIIAIQNIYIYSDSSLFFKDIINISKFLLIVCLICVFKILKKEKRHEIFKKTLDFYSVILPLLIIVPFLLDIGNSTYSNGGGYKSFFIATNDLSIVMVIISMYSFYCFKRKTLDRKKILLLFLNVLSLLLIGTKFTMVIALIIILNTLYSIVKTKKILFIIPVLFALPFIFYVGYQVLEEPIGLVFERLEYFSGIKETKISLITSSRTEFVESAFLISEGEYIQNVIGHGYNYRVLNWGKPGSVEMDFFDMYFSFGFIGLTYVLIFLSPYIKRLFLNIYYKKNLWISIMFLVLLSYSMFAGHVMFSAFSGTIATLVISNLDYEW